MLTGRKLPFTLAFAVLVLVVFGASCHGFFKDPVLQSIALDPTSPQVEATKTLQMSAWGTYDDNSRKNIASSVSWSIPTTDASIATISKTGLVTGVGAGTTTITASSQGISGTASLTVTLANLVSITVAPQTASTNSTKTVQFTAKGTFSDGSTSDVTTQVTWASSNSTGAATISNAAGTQGLATALTVTSQQTTNITATSGTIVSAAAVLTVNP